ncbi:DUF6471 domain-containing protein [Endothiovibrio diazotrophicus]
MTNETMTENEWKKEATNLLKAELARSGADYHELIRRLHEIGVEETYKSVSSKINRGTFPFVFFLQCMKALGVDTVRLAR